MLIQKNAVAAEADADAGDNEEEEVDNNTSDDKISE